MKPISKAHHKNLLKFAKRLGLNLPNNTLPQMVYRAINTEVDRQLEEMNVSIGSTVKFDDGVISKIYDELDRDFMLQRLSDGLKYRKPKISVVFDGHLYEGSMT